MSEDAQPVQSLSPGELGPDDVVSAPPERLPQEYDVVTYDGKDRQGEVSLPPATIPAFHPSNAGGMLSPRDVFMRQDAAERVGTLPAMHPSAAGGGVPSDMVECGPDKLNNLS